MKFTNDKEKVIYYYERAKFCKKKGDKEGYVYFIKKAKYLIDRIEENKDN